MGNSTLKNSVVVGLITGLSRISGFVRDFMIAKFLGAGAVSDAFLVAFKIPNLFRAIFAEGAFSSAFVPLFSGILHAKGERRARHFALGVFAWLFYILLIITMLCMIAMPFIIKVFAPGFTADPDKFDLAVELARITFPFMFFIALTAFFGAILNSLDRFKPYALSPIILNLTMICASLIGTRFNANIGHSIAWGVAIAGVLQLAIIWYAAARHGFGYISFRPKVSPEIRRFFKNIAPALLGAGIYHINILIGTIFATQTDGAISWIYYADRLNQLPIGIIGVAVATVMLPKLSRHVKKGERNAEIQSFNQSILLTSILCIPASVLLAVFAFPLFEVFFEHGRFTASDTLASGGILRILTIGMPAIILTRQFVNIFYSRGDTKTPMLASLLIMLTNLALTIALTNRFGYIGVVQSVTITNWLMILILYAISAHRGLMKIAARTIWILTIAGIISTVLGAMAYSAMTSIAPVTWLGKVGAMATVGSAFMLVYTSILWRFGAFRNQPKTA